MMFGHSNSGAGGCMPTQHLSPTLARMLPRMCGRSGNGSPPSERGNERRGWRNSSLTSPSWGRKGRGRPWQSGLSATGEQTWCLRMRFLGRDSLTSMGHQSFSGYHGVMLKCDGEPALRSAQEDRHRAQHGQRGSRTSCAGLGSTGPSIVAVIGVQTRDNMSGALIP